MRKSLLFLILICSLCLLNACGGGPGGGGNLAATHFSLTAPATVSAGSTFSVTVTALDAANNVATGYSGIVNFTSTDGQFGLIGGQVLTGATGTFPLSLRSAGTQTITATDVAKPTITGTTGSITVAIEVTRSLGHSSYGSRPRRRLQFHIHRGRPLEFHRHCARWFRQCFPWLHRESGLHQYRRPSRASHQLKPDERYGVLFGSVQDHRQPDHYRDRYCDQFDRWHFHFHSRRGPALWLHASRWNADPSRVPHDDSAERRKSARGGRDGMVCANESGRLRH